MGALSVPRGKNAVLFRESAAADVLLLRLPRGWKRHHVCDGNGTFGMTVNAINKSEGNMLYVKESNGGIYNVSLQNSNLEDIKIGEKIRFATIGNNAKTNNLGFKVNPKFLFINAA